MCEPHYKVKVPGKLFIAGEYAVTELNQDGIVAAIDRYITVDVSPSPVNRLDLPQLGLHHVNWDVLDGEIMFSVKDERLRFVKGVLEIVTAYVGSGDCAVQLTVTSELDDPSGRKYGLGSSAAIVVAVVSALLTHYKKTADLDLMTVFKLASAAHFKIQGNGSCADIAASTFGGWLNYRTFDGNWLNRQLLDTNTITEVVEREWPGLKIERLALPPTVHFVVGWTGASASTAPMVSKIHQLKETNIACYHSFLAYSQQAVEQIIEGFLTNEVDLLFEGIRRNREALRFISEHADVVIETPTLEDLATLAAEFGSGKSSGAGGGDCGIALVNDAEQATQLKSSWIKAGITPLDLHVSENGVTILN